MAWTLVMQNKNMQQWSHGAQSSKTATSSSSLDVGAFQQLDLQVLHAAHSDTSSYTTCWSNDGGTTWETAGAALTTTGASGSTSRTIDGMPGRLFKILVTETDGGEAPTLTAYVTLKKKG